MEELTFEEIDQIIDEVRRNADLEWYRTARECVLRVARSGRDFTGDDVWLILDDLPVATATPSALGAVFRDVQREGLIEKTGDVRPSRRRQAHRVKTVWRAVG